ncbi:MAG: N-6 DNA methylase [Candidatus Promineifilaceae bacterium]|nr:N-6 DNA methylase [Candidatus Promineifilaceae bacterium]
MADRQQTFGQFATPPDVADLLLAFCQRTAEERLLDPGCGAGALLERAALRRRWLASGDEPPSGGIWGVELDAAAAAVARARLPEAQILHQNFFTLAPSQPFDVLAGNPPYTRAEWIGRLSQQAGAQLPLFEAPPEGGASEATLIPNHLWQTLNNRAGLHAYFLLHGATFLREGGRLGFVVPNNWLDVSYGERLKQFLLDHYRLVAFVEPTVERWFDNASVNTCIAILERCNRLEARAEQMVHFVQLRQPLHRLLEGAAGDGAPLLPFAAADALVHRLLPGQDETRADARVRVVRQGDLDSREKWSIFWRAPALYRRARRRPERRKLAPLQSWASVRRGFTTGANNFFYLDKQTRERWEIEAEFRRPLLKSLRGVERLRLNGDGSDGGYEVLVIPPTAALRESGAGAYVAWGESQGLHRRATCASRQPWYALPWQEPAPLLLPKGIWGRHLAPLVEQEVLVDQQLYQIIPQRGAPRAAAALLNSSWAALQMELQGRVNFGEGVLWLAGYEVERLLLPEPAFLEPAALAALGAAFNALAREPVATTIEAALDTPARRHLDDLVFDLLGFSPTEATIVEESLLERVHSRQQRARAAPRRMGANE